MDLQGGRRHDRALGRLLPALQGVGVPRSAPSTGPIDGANLLDWPIGLSDLEPYYDKAEDRMGVTRTNGIPASPANNNFKVMGNGAKRAGYKDVNTGRMAFNTVPRDGRPATIQDGFNFQGDKQRAHWSTLTAEIPKAEKTGRLDLRPESMAIRIEHDDSGKVTGVVYVDAEGNEQRQQARAVCVACNAIETARLLLNSDSSLFPDGLANSSGQVGRNYMRHLTGSVYATFDKPVHMYRGETMSGIVTDESRNDPDRGFVGGYYMQLLSLGVPFLAAFLSPRAWGRDFAEVDGAVRPHGRHVAGGRGHAAGGQPRHAQPRRARPVRPAGAERALRRPPERRGDARARLRRGRVGLRRRRRHAHVPRPAVSDDPQPRDRPHERAAARTAS